MPDSFILLHDMYLSRYIGGVVSQVFLFAGIRQLQFRGQRVVGGAARGQAV
jgi:hypothetical protein